MGETKVMTNELYASIRPVNTKLERRNRDTNMILVRPNSLISDAEYQSLTS